MQLSYFSVNIDYKGNVGGFVQFSDGPTQVMHSLTQEQSSQLSALIDTWKAELLERASNKLLQARNDMLSIEHQS